MPDITTSKSHYNNAIERLPAQFKDKTNIDALIKTMFVQVQALEDNLLAIKDESRLLEAEGKQLDKYAHYLDLVRDFNETDESLFGRIAKIIIGRCSEASPDSLRRSVEAITGLTDTNIIEFSNVIEWENNNVPLRAGATLLYGIYQDDRMRIDKVYEDLIVNATPISGTSTVFGKHNNIGDNLSLFIPCEITTIGNKLLVRDSSNNLDYLVDALGNNFVARANNFRTFGEGWEYGVLPEDNIVLDEIITEPSKEPLQVLTEGMSEPTEFISGISGLELSGQLLETVQTNNIQ